MNEHRSVLLISLLLIAASAAGQTAAVRTIHTDGMPHRYIVSLSPDAQGEIPDLASALARSVGGRLEIYAAEGFRGFAVTMTAAQAEAMSHDERVTRIEEMPADEPAPPPLLSVTPAAGRPPDSAAASPLRPAINGSGVWSRDYAYDASGNVVTIGADHYYYDTAGRLVSGTIEGAANEQDYGYDTFGNRTSASRKAGALPCVAGGSTIACEESVTTSSLLNRITSNGATYDSAGNLKTLDSWTYTWDALSMMVRQQSTIDQQFVYTADDERIGIYNAGAWTWTVRGLDGKVLREFQQDGNGLKWARDYIWRNGEILAAVNPQSDGTAAVQHYHVDHLGTPRLVTDGSGNKLGLHSYYPFGSEVSLTSTENPFLKLKFTGHERDTIPGDIGTLDYMHARYYDAALGRFISTDPVTKSSARAPQRSNRYSYGVARPLGMLDPDGQVAVGFTGFAGANPSSYIHQIDRMIAGAPGLGPTKVFSSGDLMIRRSDIAKAVSFVAAAYSKDPATPVILYGHSLGGSAALDVAWELNKMSIPVALLITFDIVGSPARHTFGMSTFVVPPNVNVAVNYYQTHLLQFGNNRLEASEESTEVSNIDIGNVAHTDVDDKMGKFEAGMIRDLALEELFDRGREFDLLMGRGTWLYENSFGSYIQVERK